MENNKPELEKPHEATDTGTDTTTRTGVDMGADASMITDTGADEAKGKPQAANGHSRLITGLITVVLMGAVMLGVYLYQQSQRLQREVHPRTVGDVNIFDFREGISVSLPKGWPASTTEGGSCILAAAGLDDTGSLQAWFKIFSHKIKRADYSLERIKNLSEKEQIELAGKFVKDYVSPGHNSFTRIANRRVVDYKIIDLEGAFAIALSAEGNIGQDKVTDEVRYIFSEDHLFYIFMMCYQPSSPLFRQKLEAVLNSITLDHK